MTDGHAWIVTHETFEDAYTDQRFCDPIAICTTLADAYTVAAEDLPTHHGFTKSGKAEFGANEHTLYQNRTGNSPFGSRYVARRYRLNTLERGFAL